jgi:hypothetical protein
MEFKINLIIMKELKSISLLFLFVGVMMAHFAKGAMASVAPKCPGTGVTCTVTDDGTTYWMEGCAY